MALPVVIAGLRIATVSTVALATVGAIVYDGGLGILLLNGVNSNFRAQVLAVSLICVAMALLLDLARRLAQRLSTPWTRTAGAGGGRSSQPPLHASPTAPTAAAPRAWVTCWSRGTGPPLQPPT